MALRLRLGSFLLIKGPVDNSELLLREYMESQRAAFLRACHLDSIKVKPSFHLW